MVQQIDPDGDKIQRIRTALPSVPIIYAVKRNVILTQLSQNLFCLMIKDPMVEKLLWKNMETGEFQTNDTKEDGQSFRGIKSFVKLAPSIDIYGTFSTEILESAPEGFPSEDEPKKSNIIKMP